MGSLFLANNKIVDQHGNAARWFLLALQAVERNAGGVDGLNLGPLATLNQVNTAHIATGAVQTAKLEDGAVTVAKLDAGAITGVTDGSITTVKLADGAVTEAKLDASLIDPYGLVKSTGDLSSADLTSETALGWVAASITDIGVSGSEITVNADGTYKFAVRLMADCDDATDLEIRTYIDTGGGFSQDTAETSVQQIDSIQASVWHLAVLDLVNGDKVEFRALGTTVGTCDGVDTGTTLVSERVA